MNKYSLAQLLNKDEVKTIVNIFAEKDIEIRLVGGCVRNTILDIDNKDIDCAINEEPDTVVKILKKNNIKFKDFAKQYGLITAFIKNQKFEITSLRKDFNQQGRKTDIEFTKDWEEDAKRRDFTLNALYLDSKGRLIDYFNGLKDLNDKKVKFIGDIENSINEDYLRILRYYRFLGIFEKPKVIKSYYKILNKHFKKTFQHLSNDMIRIEILKMLKNKFPLNSFCEISNLKQKNLWLMMTKKHFLENDYKLGLNNCLNKVDKLF